MSKSYIHILTLTANYQPLAPSATIVNVEVSALPSNVGTCNFLSTVDGSTDVVWQAGEYHQFKNVDLSQIQVKGTAGDKISIVGEA